MNGVLAVIRREYLHRVLNKWFLVGTLGIPVMLVAVLAVPILMETRDDARDRRIAIIDYTGVMADPLVERLGSSFDPEVVEASSAAQTEIDRRVSEGEVAGTLVLDDESLRSGTALFRGEDRPGTVRRIQMQQAVVQTAIELRASASGDAAGLSELLEGGDLRFEDVDGDEQDAGDRVVGTIVGAVGSFALYMAILLYGVQIMRSVLEEKTTRIVEVIISAIEPWQLMLGKILGVGAVGLTQIGIWVASLVLLVSLGLPWLVAARPELAELQDLAQYLPALGGIVLFILFFVLGYFLYSSLYAATAAMCSTEEEAQQTQIPVTMLVVIPAIVLPAVLRAPDSGLAVTLSMIPFFTPILMFPRYLAGAPLWQVLASLGLVVATIGAVAWVAGRIYRVGILMQGKRPTLPELLRWVREA